jgi:hypothetical protein
MAICPQSTSLRQVLCCEGLAPLFLIELRRDQRLDSKRIIAEARPSHADEAARDAQEKLLASYIHNVIGLSAEVVVKVPGKIERSIGKAKRMSISDPSSRTLAYKARAKRRISATELQALPEQVGNCSDTLSPSTRFGRSAFHRKHVLA